MMRDWPLVLVHTDDGLTGMGRGGNVDTINNDLVPLIVGEDPRRIAMLWERMYESVWRVRGPVMSGCGSSFLTAALEGGKPTPCRSGQVPVGTTCAISIPATTRNPGRRSLSTIGCLSICT